MGILVILLHCREKNSSATQLISEYCEIQPEDSSEHCCKYKTIACPHWYLEIFTTMLQPGCVIIFFYRYGGGLGDASPDGLCPCSPYFV